MTHRLSNDRNFIQRTRILADRQIRTGGVVPGSNGASGELSSARCFPGRLAVPRMGRGARAIEASQPSGRIPRGLVPLVHGCFE